MTGVSHVVLLLSVLLLFLNPCMPQRTVSEKSLDLRERNDGHVKHINETPVEKTKTDIKQEHEAEVGSHEVTKQKDGPSVRFEPTVIH